MRDRVEDLDDAGFTLAEVLIAISILALITSLATSAILFAISATERGGVSSHERRVLAVRAVLETSIGGARPVFAAGEDGLALAFQGDRHRLQFVTRAPSPTEIPGLYGAEVFFRPGHRGGNLIMRFWPFSADDAEAANPTRVRETMLVAGVEELTFEYGTLDNSGSWLWTEQWREDSELPQMLKLGAKGTWDNVVFDLDWKIALELSGNERSGAN